MDAPDLAHYFAVYAPVDMSWSAIRNICSVRRSFGHPIPMNAYEAIRFAMADAEARMRHGVG
jgi:hypothetical protein